MSKQRRFILWVAVALLLLGAGLGLQGYALFQFQQWLVLVLALVGLHGLTAQAGLLSLGHGAFMALGAYTTAMLTHHAQWATPWAWLAAALLGAAWGAGLGSLASRLTGHLLALATFALAVAVPQVLKAPGLAAWTGGAQGLTWTPTPAFWNQPLGLTLCLLGVVGLAMGAQQLAQQRVWGWALVAMREHPVAAAELGFDLPRLRRQAFAWSGALTSLAGGMGAMVLGHVSPDAYTALLSIGLLAGLVVGGVGQLSGVGLGAAFVLWVPQWAGEFSQSVPWAIYGACLLGVAYVAPEGWPQAWRAWRRKLTKR